MSGSMALLGYTKNFYRNISVVSLQFGCISFTRRTVDIELDVKRQVFDVPIARFNRIVLPESFVQRIKDLQKQNSDRNATFYRSLFAPPLGNKGASTGQANGSNQ